MISLYCRAHHNPEGELCMECDALCVYAEQKTDKCVFGIHKPVCSRCSIHCYDKHHREKMRQVMRYAGPRMLFIHPFMGVRHVLHILFYSMGKKQPGK
ncbi:MAG: nitrous oxide-stimulated promoter family protein [Spirochaetales bacterium]|nr:nitrous oxide-stimulated promoter family protein [Spirochaetales bacterium]